MRLGEVRPRPRNEVLERMNVNLCLDPLAILEGVVACSIHRHTITHTHPCPYSSKWLCQACDTSKLGPFQPGISEQDVGLLMRESSKMMFKSKWFLTKMERVCLSAGWLVSRTTDPGMQRLFGATISVLRY